MKITNKQLKQLIKEEAQSALAEGVFDLLRKGKKSESEPESESEEVSSKPEVGKCRKYWGHYIELKISNPTMHGWEGDQHMIQIEKMEKEVPECLNDEWYRKLKAAMCPQAEEEQP